MLLSLDTSSQPVPWMAIAESPRLLEKHGTQTCLLTFHWAIPSTPPCLQVIGLQKTSLEAGLPSSHNLD
jgi:hypothetical protein